MKISKNFILSIVFVIISLFVGLLAPNFALIIEMMEKQAPFLSFLLIAFSFVVYILALIFLLPKIKCVRFLMYPMSAFALYLWTNSILYHLKNPVIYMAMSFVFFPVMFGVYIWGLIKDVEDVKRNPKEGNHFATVLFFIVSVIFLLYLGNIVVPFGSKHVFFHKPSHYFDVIYMWMTIPASVIYTGFCIWVFEKLQKVRWVAYSLMVFNLYFALLFCLLHNGGIVHGAALFAIVMISLAVLLPTVLGAIVLGAVQDLQEENKL